MKAADAAKAKLARSLVTTRDIKSGEVFEFRDLALKSPGNGFSWNESSKVIGTVARKDVPKDRMIMKEDLE